MRASVRALGAEGGGGGDLGRQLHREVYDARGNLIGCDAQISRLRRRPQIVQALCAGASSGRCPPPGPPSPSL